MYVCMYYYENVYFMYLMYFVYCTQALQNVLFSFVNPEQRCLLKQLYLR